MYIEINTETLARDTSTVGDRLEALESAVTAMYSCLENLNGMWQGPAHDTFVAQTEVDHESFGLLFQEIRNMVSCMEYARGQYDKCQSDVNSLIASIHM